MIQTLADRAEMCPALTDHDALDFRTADRAGLPLAAIHPEMILKVAAPVYPVNACPVAANAFLQCLPDRHPKDLGFFHRYGIRDSQGMKPGLVQGFVGIDVAQPRQEGLVEQERFDLPALGVQRCMQPGWSECLREGLGADALEYFGGVFHQPDPAELARIGKGQRDIPGQPQNQPVMLGRLVSADDHQQIAAHPKVDDEMGFG